VRSKDSDRPRWDSRAPGRTQFQLGHAACAAAGGRAWHGHRGGQHVGQDGPGQLVGRGQPGSASSATCASSTAGDGPPRRTPRMKLLRRTLDRRMPPRRPGPHPRLESGPSAADPAPVRDPSQPAPAASLPVRRRAAETATRTGKPRPVPRPKAGSRQQPDQRIPPGRMTWTMFSARTPPKTHLDPAVARQAATPTRKLGKVKAYESRR
jgi:hypothetical protein